MAERIHRERLRPGESQTLDGLSFEQFLTDFAEQQAEWLMGKVIVVTNNTQHQRLLFFLGQLFGLFMGFKSLGEVLLAGVPMYISDQQPAREPDLLIVLNENRHRIQANYLAGPADLVVEIVSPESASRDREDKVIEYAQAGVPEYWLIDPLLKGAVVYVLGADATYQMAPPDAEGRLVSTVLPGFRLNPALLWQEILPTGAELVALAQGMA